MSSMANLFDTFSAEVLNIRATWELWRSVADQREPDGTEVGHKSSSNASR